MWRRNFSNEVNLAIDNATMIARLLEYDIVSDSTGLSMVKKTKLSVRLFRGNCINDQTMLRIFIKTNYQDVNVTDYFTDREQTAAIEELVNLL